MIIEFKNKFKKVVHDSLWRIMEMSDYNYPNHNHKIINIGNFGNHITTWFFIGHPVHVNIRNRLT